MASIPGNPDPRVYIDEKYYKDPRKELIRPLVRAIKETVVEAVDRHDCSPPFHGFLDAASVTVLAKQEADAAAMPDLGGLEPSAEQGNVWTPREKDLIQYARTEGYMKVRHHWGRMKLALSELQFLTYAHRIWKQEFPDERPLVIYAGAASGGQLALLPQLFPMFDFEVYDVNDFDRLALDYAEQNPRRLVVHKTLFDDGKADFHGADSRPKFFISDIRTGTEVNEESVREENVAADMRAQLEWAVRIGQRLSMFKFRLPYCEPGQDVGVKYVPGYIYLQPWATQTATETRLICHPTAENRGAATYSSLRYERAMFWHNQVWREFVPVKNVVHRAAPGLNQDADSFAAAETVRFYLRNVTMDPDPSALKVGGVLAHFIHKLTERDPVGLTPYGKYVRGRFVYSIRKELDSKFFGEFIEYNARYGRGRRELQKRNQKNWENKARPQEKYKRGDAVRPGHFGPQRRTEQGRPRDQEQTPRTRQDARSSRGGPRGPDRSGRRPSLAAQRTAQQDFSEGRAPQETAGFRSSVSSSARRTGRRLGAERWLEVDRQRLS